MPESCHNSPSGEKVDSIKGKRKKTDEGDGAASSKIIIPWELHLMIQKALKLRELVKLNKLNYPQYDSESESDYGHEFELEQCEDTVRNFVKMFKKLNQLPCDWEYDPDTASTFVAAEADQSAFPKMPPPKKKSLGCCSWVIHPINEKLPKTRDVPLNEEENKIWLDFIELAKPNPGLRSIPVKTVDQHKRPLLLDNPIVSLASKFAVAAFNEAIEMYTDKGENNNVIDVEVVECKYLKAIGWGYFFYITIEAFEEGKLGVYDTEVQLNWDDGSKSLSCFVLTNRKPNGVRETRKRKSRPDSCQDGFGIKFRWMRPRLGRGRGYDYLTPYGDDGP